MAAEKAADFHVRRTEKGGRARAWPTGSLRACGPRSTATRSAPVLAPARAGAPARAVVLIVSWAAVASSFRPARADQASSAAVADHGPGDVRVGGRVFARATLASAEAENATLDLSVASARAEVQYRFRGWRAVVEADLAGGVEFKDAFVRGGVRTVRFYAGQLKPPILAVEMTSSWELPVVRRGLLHEILVDRYLVAGRRPGAMVEWRPRDLSRLRAFLGVFQAGARDPQELGGVDEVARDAPPEAKTAAARVEVMPARGLEVAAFGEARGIRDERGDVEPFWVAGLDATFRRASGCHGARVWAEGLFGTSWYDANLFDDDEPFVAAGRLIAAWRWGGMADGARYVEPFFLAAALDPDLGVRSDAVLELAVGVNIGAWRRVRLQFQGEGGRASRHTPPALKLRDRAALLAQVGVSF